MKRYIYFILVAAACVAVFLIVQMMLEKTGASLEQSVRSSMNAALVSTQFGSFIQEKKDAQPVTLLFTGDIMLARGVAGRIQRNSGDIKFPFLHAAETLRSADFTVGNLETTISDRGANQGSIYSFRADPRVVEGLQFAGFDLLTLANNHMWDWGPDALSDTVGLLQAAGFGTAGVGRTEQEANAAYRKEIRGTTFAFLAFTNLYPKSLTAKESTPGISRFEEEDIVNAVRNAKGTADVVVVSMHWGEEYRDHSTAEQERLGQRIIDAGAQLIVGHHPHVTEEMGRYNGGWIAYSLGNFVFDQNFSDATQRGNVLRVTVKDKTIVNAELLPVRINKDFQPVFFQ